MSDMEIVKEFLVESYENLDRLDQDLITLEKDPSSRDTLASIFRTIHTIKGTSGFLAFNQLEAVAHVGENLLSRLRDGLLPITAEITTGLLAMVDAIREMLKNIESLGTEGERNDQKLIATLTRLLEPKAAGTTEGTAPAAGEEKKSQPSQSAPKADRAVPQPATAKASEPVAAKSQSGGDSQHISDPAGEKRAPIVQDPGDAAATQQQARGQGASDSTIRVDVSLLDQLMNLVGELVLARNQILQSTNSTEESSLLATSQRLNLITTELQEGVMKTRMQPIGNIWSKFPRTVRDVATSCGKQVRIEMEGKETELDKTIIEAIKDPLTHLVRNAVDHGIERPEVRQAAGKSTEGRLSLRAFHEGGQVNIEITDDGAGLDHEKIRQKSIEKGLASADQAARMTEREIANLIFLPGFSTAEKVTNVSGRGVGMDVVKTNIEKIGGTVDIQSRAGQGSTVRMKIPLTLAIIPALIVTSAGDRYAIPQVNLLELVRLEGEQARKGIEEVHGAPVHRLRGRLLPLVYLNRELKVEANTQLQSAQTKRGTGAVDLDFSMVRDKHRKWISTLQDVLAGKLLMSVQEAGSHEGCALGKWIYGAGLIDYGSINDMHVLEQTHRQFHDLVRNVVVLRAEGKEIEAKQELASVISLSERIMELTSRVERSVHELHSVNIVVLQADDRQFGLVVDEINDTEEIVVKPLSKQLKSINIYAGATIMGDGRVALILDVLGLAQCSNVVSAAHDRSLTDLEDRQSSSADSVNRKPVLLFQYASKGQMAIDLSLVARLEEFPADVIEIADGQEAVQYRGQIMPLIRVSDILQTSSGGSNRESGQPIQVVVYADKERSVGLIIDRILDIVEEPFVLERQTGRKGVLGSAVIQKRITDVLDVPGLIAAARGERLAKAAYA